ncbi:hypothetical protein [Salipaludibacillus daqingensis]|uniref:hypothetical protein n=1 Tax=Salipaludibacillus daqingensis TaxID=3041001 RepID=UPI0024766B2C|nr:hypothetical protein [Salipaludibacillus daqingensis]
MKGFKRSVIKEELVKLTGDYKLAIILNQMIYWSEHYRCFDKFIAEAKRWYEDSESDLTRGWFYKTEEELAEETLINIDQSSIRGLVDQLVEAGWLEERNHSIMPFDDSKEYRVNLRNIQKDLNRMGCYLEGYTIDIPHPTVD